MDDDDDDDDGDELEACDDDGDGPALGPLGNAIVATVVGGLILMAVTRVLLAPRQVVQVVPAP